MCKDQIFEAHLSQDRAKALFHSSSFTANPIACAAALANLDIWEKGDARDAMTRTCALQEERIARFARNPSFRNVRRIGTIAALDLAVDAEGYLATVGLELMRFFNARGLLLRPLGPTIYVLPPYCVTAQNLDLAYAAIEEAAEAFGGKA
jgi:adenosylmethionine---8-amino-7-oxononanoate aminotransferase